MMRTHGCIQVTYNILLKLNLDLLSRGDSPGIATRISFGVMKDRGLIPRTHEAVSPGHKSHMVDGTVTIVHAISRMDTRASAAFLKCRGKSHNPFLLSLALSPEPHGRSCQVPLLAGARTWPPCSFTSSPATWL